MEPCGAREEAEKWPELPERNKGKPGLDSTGCRQGRPVEKALTWTKA